MGKLLRVVNREQCIGCFSCMFSCSRTWFGAITLEKAAMRVKNYNGVEGVFSIRCCYGCEDPDCVKACPTQALTAKNGGGIQFTKEKCKNCGDCVKACAPKALQWDFENKVPIPCHQCGVCTQFCPNKVIEMCEISK